jgi:hypothetical protein
MLTQSSGFSTSDLGNTDAREAGDEHGSGELSEDAAGKAVTTQEEIEGFYIVKAIVSEIIDAKRIFLRDTIRFCGILLDDTNRKPICRLWFNNPEGKQLGLFDGNKQEIKYPINNVNDLYKFAEQLKERVLSYDSGAPMSGSEGQRAGEDTS